MQPVIRVAVLSIVSASAGATPNPTPPAAVPAPPMLHQVLEQNPEALRRESAALILGVTADRSAVPLLLQRLQDDDNRWVRSGCAEALGLLGDPIAAAPLRSALNREKHPRVRRAIAEALMRLGDRTGVGELMWQLGSGNNHTKAEVMRFFVRSTAQPLGQDAEGWWRYFGRPLKQEVGRPAAGVLELTAQVPGGTPLLHSTGLLPPWRLICVHRLRLPTEEGRITRTLLETHARGQGLPGACLLLLQREAAPMRPPLPAGTTRAEPVVVVPEDRDRSRQTGPAPAAPEPGLAHEAAAYLIQERPKLLGVALSSYAKDQPEMSPRVRELLLARGWLVIEGLADPDKRLPDAFRLLVIPGAATGGRAPVRLLALLE